MPSRILTLLALAALAPVTGCTSVQDPFLTGSTNPVAIPSLSNNREVGAHLALASLPGAGAVLAVRQTLGPDTTRQTIVLANPMAVAGENMLTIEVAPATGKRFAQAPSRSELQAEMRAALPGIAMSISNTMNENAYGVYGYAVGKTTGVQCIYAWQVIDAGRRSTIGAPHGASIRLRLCRAGESAEHMASLMRGLTVKAIDAATLASLRIAAPAAPLSLDTGRNLASDEVMIVEENTNIDREVSLSHQAVATNARATVSLPDGDAPVTKPSAAPTTRVSVPLPEE